MRLAESDHSSRPWRIHEIAPDFQVEDVWALPAAGGPEDFPELVATMAEADPEHGSSRIAGLLWSVRWKVGDVLGWDEPDAGVGSRAPTLRDRLPADLRDGPRGPEFPALPFTSVFQTGDEFVAELANRTVHALMHLGWVPDGSGGYRGQMAVLVKPNGRFGAAYLAAIKPFRLWVVYPPAFRRFEADWRARGGRPATARPS